LIRNTTYSAQRNSRIRVISTKGWLLFQLTVMALINLKDFIEKEKVALASGDIFVGRVGKNSLIGPKVSSSFCSVCLKKRILSSEFREFIDYCDFVEDDKAKDYLKRRGLENLMIEIAKNEIVIEHNFILVPGCNHSYEDGK